MDKKIRILFVSQHVVHDAIYQAGHRSFNYYLSRFCADPAFEVGYIVDQHGDDSFRRMKSQFAQARDFSVSTPKLVRLLKYLFYYSFSKLLLSLINPTWLYLDPFRAFVYKRALARVKAQGWIPDVIAFEWTEVLFLQAYCRRQFREAVLVATEHDVSFNKLFRQYEANPFVKTGILPRFKDSELTALKKLDLVVVLSENDSRLLRENRVPTEKILLMAPFYNRTNQRQGEIRPQVLFYGAMNRPENREAVRWFLENVFLPYRLHESVSFLVVGAGAPDDFRKRYEAVPNVAFTGFVERPERYFESALCMVVPLTYGGGIKIKVLEAMSASVTVLSNAVGIEGINAVAGESYLPCSEPVDYRDAIQRLRADVGLARSIGEAGRLMMESGYNFGESYGQYRNRLLELCQPQAVVAGPDEAFI